MKKLLPFIPSGRDFETAKSFFTAIGFETLWENDGLCGLKNGGAEFVLQNYEHEEMQQNLMLQAFVEDLDQFYQSLVDNNIGERFPGVRYKEPADQPWGFRELHLIDPAGVCWHFVQS